VVVSVGSGAAGATRAVVGAAVDRGFATGFFVLAFAADLAASLGEGFAPEDFGFTLTVRAAVLIAAVRGAIPRR
jgi:hypothetical protein